MRASQTGEGCSLRMSQPLIRHGLRARHLLHKGRREEEASDDGYAASTRLKPFHIAVAAPEVSTGKMRVS